MTIEIKREYFSNGVIKMETYYHMVNGELVVGRQDDHPAIIHYNTEGTKRSEHYLRNGKYLSIGDSSEENIPSLIIYYPNGHFKSKEWYIVRQGYNSLDDSIYYDHSVYKLIHYYHNGNIKSEEWYCKEDWKSGLLENEDDLPAKKTYFENGAIKEEFWMKDGDKHRDDDKPAVVTYYSNGIISAEKWYQKDVPHRDGDKPAIITYYPTGDKKKEIYLNRGHIYRFGRDDKFQPLASFKYYHVDNRIEEQYIFTVNSYEGDEDGCIEIELSKDNYIKLLYLFRRKINSIKKKKRSELKDSLTSTQLISTGTDVCKKISEFLY